MNDKQQINGVDESPVEKSPVEAKEPPQADLKRRSAVSYLLVGAGIAVAGLLAPRRAHALYGKCYKCSCCAFEGTQNNCSNCGHQYSDHTGQTC